MSPVGEGRGPTAFQLEQGVAGLAVDAEGRQIVSVGWKETYLLDESGECRPDEDQPAIQLDASGDTGASAEPEFLPYKLATDVVVVGNAHAPGGGPVREMTAAVQVGRTRKEIRVVGDRRCAHRRGKPPLVSEPEPFTAMPLDYTRAYGGIDETLDEGRDPTAQALAPRPGSYPRNDIGRGYVVYNQPGRVEGLALPNLEDPGDPLAPERLIVGDLDQWWRQPLPQSFEWHSPGWFPRVVHLGAAPDGLPEDDREVPEVKRGYLAPGFKRRCEEDPLQERIGLALTNGASPGLVLPYLRGDEEIHLEGLRVEGALPVRLPARPPRLSVRFRGRSEELPAVLHTVLVEVEERRLRLVWRGAWYPPVSLPRRLPTIREPEVDPLEGVEIRVGGRILH